MRLAYLSPLPPATSGIADYSAALLPELARQVEVDAFSEPGQRSLAHYDAVIYQLGNSAHHGAIYDALVQYPGILDLHDGTLHHFFVDRTLHRGNAPAYLREMAYAHGAEGYDIATAIVRGAGIYPFYRFPLIRRAVDLAMGVIVHSETIRRLVLEARPDARVQVIDHLAFPPAASTKTREALLQELGLPRDAFIIASFGQITFGKRAEVVLAAFARFAALEPRARFVWVGDLSAEYDLRPEIRRLGLERRVYCTGRVPAAALPDYLALCDVAINLRYPTTGEASGGVMRLLAYGKPTLVSNVGWFAELPSETVVQIDVGQGEV